MANRLKLNPLIVKTFARNRATLHVAKTARQIETAAKRLAPVRKPDPPRNSTGGRLRASIGTRMGDTTYHVWAKVGSKVKYAEYAHSGARPHVIRARRKPLLVFPWPGGPVGIVVQKGKWQGWAFMKKVNHPGMKGTRFLVRPLVGIGRANGFRVVTRRTLS